MGGDRLFMQFQMQSVPIICLFIFILLVSCITNNVLKVKLFEIISNLFGNEIEKKFEWTNG